MNIEYDDIESIEILDEIDDVYDIINFEALLGGSGVMDGEGHFIANGIIVHNCIPDYVRRRDDKSQSWTKEEHPEVAELLKETYGIIVYQEQLQEMWQKFAGFTAPEAEAGRKAVAKKWTHLLKPIEEQWMRGATKTLGEKWATYYWERMVTFGRYAFNKCISMNSMLNNPETSEVITVDELFKSKKQFKLASYNRINDKFFSDDVVEVIDCGIQDIYRVELENGVIEEVTLDHRYLCDDNQYHTVRDIYASGYNIIVRDNDNSSAREDIQIY